MTSAVYNTCLENSLPIYSAVNSAVLFSDLDDQTKRTAYFYDKRSRLEFAVIEKVVSRLACQLTLSVAPVLIDDEFIDSRDGCFTRLHSLKMQPYAEEIGETSIEKSAPELLDFLERNAPALTSMYVFVCFCGAERQAIHSGNVMTDSDLSGFYFIDFEDYFSNAWDNDDRLKKYLTIFNPFFDDYEYAQKPVFRKWAATLFDQDAFDDAKTRIEALTEERIKELVISVTEPLKNLHPLRSDLIDGIGAWISDHLVSRRENFDSNLSKSFPGWLLPSRPNAGPGILIASTTPEDGSIK